MAEVVTATNLCLGYDDSVIIKDANFTFQANEFVVITGPSGSGKSTLLKSLYGDVPVLSGELNVCLCDMSDVSSGDLRDLRRKIGIVFQDYRLIEEWTVEKNIMLPLLIGNYRKDISRAQAEKLLKYVSLQLKFGKYPRELSGGEQQRIAVARAMAHNPPLLLCDEPTGNLDEMSSNIIWRLLQGAREHLGACVIVVTHKRPEMLRFQHRHFELKNGTLNEVN